jgi:hypothetical protein
VITEAGRRIVEERRTAGNAWLAERLSQLSDAERAGLAAALDMVERVVLPEGAVHEAARLAALDAAEAPAR